ncbi:pepsin A-4 [Striga asiatica]|uniref:Pepsin A-4 n=1 Tax=Striga asiatica TaxID=4170 RepID=A0A5A7QNC9_STRAF|nr:pepsin A-4 [Striga asiatica]
MDSQEGLLIESQLAIPRSGGRKLREKGEMIESHTLNPEFQFFPIPTREKESHVALNDEPVKTVTDLSVSIPNASGHTLPHHLPAVAPDLEAIAVIFCLVVIAHET